MSNWGKGAVNNTIGWGQGGVNNSIGWGSVYDRSASGQTLLNPLPKELIIRINTALGDGLNQMRMPLQSTQPMTIDWDDDTVETVTQTAVPASDNWVTHTYASGGIYDIKVSNVDDVRFANEGDRLKPLEVLNWGTYGILQANQSLAFRGCNNLTEIADNGDWFDIVTNGLSMFQNNSLTSLPSGMELPLLSNGSSMFQANSITSLPSGMELPLLTTGSSMFLGNSLTSLPTGMELPLLSNGSSMFQANSITSLPSGMELPALTNGIGMFANNSLTSLPTGMTLPLLTNGIGMFLGNSLNTDALSSLYIKMSVLNPNNNVPFHGGSGKFDPTFTEVINGVTYNTGTERANLVSRGWTLTDGGAIPDFILQINTSLGDGLNQMRMPLQSTQPMTIDWGDGTVETVTQTAVPASNNWVTHTYASAGIYDIEVSNVDIIRFNDEGDRLKPLEVTNWGTYGVSQADQTSAFFGCNNLTSIADGGAWFDVVTVAGQTFRNCSLTSLPSGMNLPLLTNGGFMFFSNSLTSLPSGMELPALTNGTQMFTNNSLTTLPSGMTLPALTIGQSMFFNNSLTSLPSGMELPLLTNGFSMFNENSLTSLPAGMELPLLTNGFSMFRSNSLTSLPSVMTLASLTSGQNMFIGNSLTSLPSGMELPLLTNGSNMFLSSTLNTDALSSIYIKMSVLNPNNNVPFHGGSGKFDPTFTEVINGVTYNTGDARADLVNRGWTLTDGGAI